MAGVRIEIEEGTGLNLFEDKTNAVEGFPHTTFGYNKQVADSYIQDLEQWLLEMGVQLWEQRREMSSARAQAGAMDFVKLDAHVRGSLGAAEAQATELVHLAEAEPDRLRQGVRSAAAATRGAAQQETDGACLSGLASLRRPRQKQAEAGQTVPGATRRDASLVRADAEAQSKPLLGETPQHISAQLGAVWTDAARTHQEAERSATAIRLVTEKSIAVTLSKQAETVRRTEENVSARLTRARSRSEAVTKQIEEARTEAIKIQEFAVEETEQIRTTTTHEVEATLLVMREGVRQKQGQLEEQVAWRKEQPERKVAALMVRQTSTIASMQNLRTMAERAVSNMEPTEVISGGEATAPQPRERKQAKRRSLTLG